MTKTSRLAALTTQIEALRTYSRADELELLAKVDLVLQGRRSSAQARSGDAALSDGERNEQARIAKKQAAKKTAPRV